MRTKSSRANKINVVTLGCSKNLVDSEVLMGQLRASKLDVTHESTKDNANIVVINTCGFIGNAKQESIDTILHFARQKEKGKSTDSSLQVAYRSDINLSWKRKFLMWMPISERTICLNYSKHWVLITSMNWSVKGY